MPALASPTRQPESAGKHQFCGSGLGSSLSCILSFLGNALSTPAMLPAPRPRSGWTPLKQPEATDLLTLVHSYLLSGVARLLDLPLTWLSAAPRRSTRKASKEPDPAHS